ncbi:glycosyltransferase family 4 protein [bacterium]|nr:glycosyltransferase family 4 protein [bacterium]
MKINILLPFKEKFDRDKASSVSITVKNNLEHSQYLNNVKVFGQQTDNPLFEKNFCGIKYSFFSFKSKNHYLADQMLKVILNSNDKYQIIEIHNRPYLLNFIYEKTDKFPITLFFHNDPKTMKGSKSVLERKKILEKCEAIFCVSKYIKKQFLDGIKVNHKKVFVLHNGVNRTLTKFPFKKKEVIFVGRLVLEKGVDLYIDVVSSAAKFFPDWNFGLIGSYRLGDNDNTNSYAYKVIKKFKKIGNQAKFYGFKDYDFVQKKMKGTSIIIIPSLWEEPFGLVAAEAMSNGISIIASKVGGIPEIIQNNGILIENINFKKLENALIDLMKNEHKRHLYQKKSWDNFKLSSETSSKKLDEHRSFIFQNHY